MSDLDFFLKDFVKEKIKNYQEPERKGTPKGDPIGFTKTKYTASLYFLYDLSLKEIAQELHISYGVLRKWRTEKPFNYLIGRHLKEFGKLFWDHLLKIVKEGDRLATPHLKETPITSLKKKKQNDVFWKSDAGFYGKTLRGYLLHKAMSPEFETESETWTLMVREYFTDNIIEIWSTTIKKPNARTKTFDEELIKNQKDRRNIMNRSLIDNLIKVLERDNITEDERRWAIYSLTKIRKALE